jgi:hypothetical protein
VIDLCWQPSDQVLLLLRRTPEAQGIRLVDLDERVLLLDLHGDELIAAESEPFSVNAHRFDAGPFEYLHFPMILVLGGGTGECGVLLRRDGRRLEFERCKSGSGTQTFFSCWTGLQLIDRDNDGVPEVRGLGGKWRNCPACGKESQGNWVTWRKVDGVYCRWTEFGDECGLSCELAWSN